MSGERRPRVLFHVQHLLGIGHLKRAATLARAAEEHGLEVTLVSGGHEVPGLDVGGARLVQLDSMRAADKSFKVLVDANDRRIDDGFRTRRCERLLALFGETTPDIVMTELFPFGRRQLSYELMPLLEAAKSRRPRPAVICSVRDILVEPPKPERVQEMLERLEGYYDLVLVHGDPSLVPFGKTFPLAGSIAGMLQYTGYVVEQPRPNDSDAGRGEVIVSAGGGAVSETLFRAAMAARPLTRLSDATWRILAGHALPEGDYRAIEEAAPAGIIVERARPDFLTLLSNCAVSVSQGGYNTVMEVMAAGARGVIVPYAGGLETEQTLRAQLLSERAGLLTMPEADVSAATVARAVDAALDRPPAGLGALDTGGAAASARLLVQLARERTPAPA